MDFSEMIKIAIEAVNEMRKIRDKTLLHSQESQYPGKIKSAIEQLEMIYNDCQSKLAITIQENQIVIDLFQLFAWHYVDIYCCLIDKHDAVAAFKLAVYDWKRVEAAKNWRRRFPIGSPPDIAVVFPTENTTPQQQKTPDITAQINIQNIINNNAPAMPQRVTLDGINPHALHELKEAFTPEQTPAPQGETPNKQEQKLFILFPAFEKHSKELKEKGFYEQKGDFLEWKHGKSPTLAFYFGTLQKKTKRVGNIGFMWAEIETAFSAKNLAQYWKTNQDGEYAYNHKKKNVSAYENKLLEIIKNT